MAENRKVITHQRRLLPVANPISVARRRIRWFNQTMKRRSREFERWQRLPWDSEKQVSEIAREYRLEHSTFDNIRIPNPDKKIGRGEVDVVLVTDRATILIEVKHWKGSIHSFKDDNDELDIYQEGKEVTPVISKLRKKCDMLNRMSVSRFSKSAGEVIPLVVLTHDKADLEDQVSRMPSVCWIRGNRKQRETRLHGALDTLLKGLDKEKESHTAGVSSMIESFGTWDSVEYSGGYKEFGDFDKIPDDWDREELESVEFEVSGGRLATLLRGPRIKTTLKSRDGTVREYTSSEEGIEVGLYRPWEKKGMGFPVEHLSRIHFGYSRPVDWSQASKARKREGPSNRDAWKRFKKGDVVEGTILAHLGPPGPVHSVLVSLIENQVQGRASIKGLDCPPEVFEFLYARKKQITVKVLEAKANDKIMLSIVEP